uniref:BTB domain-containing protein n=1 Tax=Panagrolaimus davidi TaxID=227884 RepID=A0A914QRL8_9BILA
MSCSKLSTTEKIPISVRMKTPKEKLLIENQKDEWQIYSEDFYVKELPDFSYCVGISSQFVNAENQRSLLITLVLKPKRELNMTYIYKIILPSFNFVSEHKGSKLVISEHYVHTRLRKMDELFDPTKKWFAHRVVVESKSPEWKEMIQSGLKESEDGKIAIDDFDFKIVEIALKFCYGIEEKHLWSIDSAIEVLEFADKYDLNDLKVRFFY